MVMSPGLYENAASSNRESGEVLPGVDPPLEVQRLFVRVHEDV